MIVQKIKNILFKYILSKEMYFRKQEKSINQTYNKLLDEARNSRDNNEIKSLEHSRDFELRIIQEDRESLYTLKLLKKASRLKVPVPEHYDENKNKTDYWKQGSFGSIYLTKKGIKRLREEIREEEKWYIEKRAHYIKWVTALTGIIGTLTGLIAIILN